MTDKNLEVTLSFAAISLAKRFSSFSRSLAALASSLETRACSATFALREAARLDISSDEEKEKPNY